MTCQQDSKIRRIAWDQYPKRNCFIAKVDASIVKLEATLDKSIASLKAELKDEDNQKLANNGKLATSIHKVKTKLDKKLETSIGSLSERQRNSRKILEGFKL
jgi:hypothetical protein